jgi:thioredoxin reductase
MISREERNRPDDAGHVQRLESAGAEVIRGTARLVGAGAVEVRNGGSPRTLETEALILAIGSTPLVPDIEGLEEAGYWTSDDATSTRELPSSIVVMGGGVVGVEMAQVFARFGVKTTLVQGNERILPRDHPRSSALLADQLREEGVDIRTGVTATSVKAGGAGRVVSLSDGSTVEAVEIMVAVGRRPKDQRAMGGEEAGVTQDDLGVRYITYWFDYPAQRAFCLVDAPDADTAQAVHAAAHGLLPNRIIPVKEADVRLFMGSPPDDEWPGRGFVGSSVRAIMFTDIVESTALTAQLGDTAAMEVLRAHNSVVRVPMCSVLSGP